MRRPRRGRKRESSCPPPEASWVSACSSRSARRFRSSDGRSRCSHRPVLPQPFEQRSAAQAQAPGGLGFRKLLFGEVSRYLTGAESIVCAEDATFLWSTYLKSTGNCRLTATTEQRKIDDGFNVHEETVAKIVFDAQTSRAPQQAARSEG